jgi:hypothetical protein
VSAGIMERLRVAVQRVGLSGGRFGGALRVEEGEIGSFAWELRAGGEGSQRLGWTIATGGCGQRMVRVVL